jgi:GWxTD domain-containing protein
MKSVFLLFFIFTAAAFSQFPDEFPQTGVQRTHPVSFEAIPYRSEDTTSIELAIFYRIHPDFFFFSKVHSAQKDVFEAKGEIVFEVSDEKNNTVKREFRPIFIERNSIPDGNAPLSEEIHGVLSFTLKKDSYHIVIEAKDIESNKSYINRDTKIDTREPFSGISLSSIIFVESPSQDTIERRLPFYIPLNYNGNVLLGQSGGCFFQMISSDSMSDVHLSWSITSKDDQYEDIPFEVHGEKFVQEYGTPQVLENVNHGSLSLQRGSKRSRLVFIPISLERLESGIYTLTITVSQGSLKASKNFSFNVLWPHKPYSLSNFKLAVEAVRHIATDSELDSMTAFSTSKSEKAFRAFWRRRNPDTTRAFNPTMAEYYRRVDDALKRYSSANEFDGFRTDRGRIYILFGAPSFTNRLLKPNKAPTEIWTYEKLKRRFTFADQHKTGNYILLKMENY